MKQIRLILEIAIALCIIATLLTLFVRYPVYTVGLKLLRYERETLAVLLLLRFALAIPWRSLAPLHWQQKTLLAAAALVGGAMFREALLFSGWNVGIERAAIDQMTFGNVPYEEISADVGHAHVLYPDPVFVAKVEALIPADPETKILYLGDQRPYIWAQKLYPRQLYCPPELQRMLNEAVQVSWQWTGISDPNYTVASPLVMPVDPGLDPVDPAVQAQLREFIESNEIEWLIFNDSAWPERRFVVSLDGDDAP